MYCPMPPFSVDVCSRAVAMAAGGCRWAQELGAGELVVWSAFDGYDHHFQVSDICSFVARVRSTFDGYDHHFQVTTLECVARE